MLPTCVKHCVAARIILLLVLELRPLTHLHSQGLAGASCGRLHTMVRPVETMLRTLRMTIAAARASRPAPALPSTQDGRGVRSYDDTLLPRLASSVAAHEVTWRYTRNARMHRSFRPHATGSTDAGVCAPLVGSSMNTMLGLATCTMSASTMSAPATPSMFQELPSSVSIFGNAAFTFSNTTAPQHASRGSPLQVAARQLCKARQPQATTCAL